MGYLTSYFLVSWLMPWLIKKFQEKKLTSDLTPAKEGQQKELVPIMGGILLIFVSLISTFLWVWAWQGPYIFALCATMVIFGGIGFFDDLAKIAHKQKIEKGLVKKKGFDYKGEGLSEKARWFWEFGSTILVLGLVFFVFSKIDTRLQVPFVPIKTFFPELPVWMYYAFATTFVVIGANSVNMTDGLDSMVTVPLLTCLFFVASIAYVSGDLELSTKLKIPYSSAEIKEITVWASLVIGALMAFLKFNCPPASIYMGDVGSLALGASLCMSFLFVKAEIYLSIAGGIFFITGLSSLIQRVYFKMMLKKKGRDYAEKNRFFYRAPYHHHKQAFYSEEKPAVFSFYQSFLNRFLWFSHDSSINKPKTKEGINSKIVWHNLIKAVWLLVVALIIFFKIR